MSTLKLAPHPLVSSFSSFLIWVDGRVGGWVGAEGCEREGDMWRGTMHSVLAERHSNKGRFTYSKGHGKGFTGRRVLWEHSGMVLSNKEPDQ